MSKSKTHFLIRNRVVKHFVRCACFLKYYRLDSLVYFRLDTTFDRKEVTCGNCKRSKIFKEKK